MRSMIGLGPVYVPNDMEHIDPGVLKHHPFGRPDHVVPYTRRWWWLSTLLRCSGK
jgi:hypothetical protein